MTIQEFISNFFASFQSIGGFASVVLTLVAFWGVVSKKPKEKVRNMIREEVKEANKDIQEKVEVVAKKVKSVDQTNLAILRNTITHIYFKYKDAKKIPHYEKENALYLYEQYERLGGNSYVVDIISQIKTWEEIV